MNFADMDFQNLRLALWQCTQQSADVKGNLARLRKAALEAAAAGAQVLVCPEMFLTGYNIGAAEAERLAEPADGPSARVIALLALETGLAIVWGFPERGPSGAVYNAVQATGPQGESLGLYRKTHLYGALDRAMFSASNGDVPVISLLGWKIGLLICYDLEFPEAVRQCALRGANLVLVPTANMKGFEVVQRVLVPARACENQLYVAYANCCGHEAEIEYSGLSCVAAPDGTVTAQAGGGAGLLLATVSRRHVGFDFNRYLADRRPDVYRGLAEWPDQSRDLAVDACGTAEPTHSELAFAGSRPHVHQ